MKINVIIVDDEHYMRDTLQRLLEQLCPSLSVVALPTTAAEEGLAQQPDIAFFNIDMPKANHSRILDRCRQGLSSKIVFTTMINYYVVRAFRYKAIEYLMQLVNLGELQQVIQKAKTSKPATTLPAPKTIALPATPAPAPVTVTTTCSCSGKLALPTLEGYTFVKMEQVIRLEAEGNYTKVYIGNKEELLITRTLKEFEEVLPDFFFRTHKSHIINLNYIKKFYRHQGYIVMEDNSRIDVATRRRDLFLESINKL